MKKRIFLIFSLIFLCGCNIISPQGTNIETPRLGESPIYGKWVISKLIYNENLDIDSFQFKEVIGSEVIFSNEKSLLLNDYIDDVKYQSKYVKLSEYLYNKFNINYKALGFEEDDDVYVTYVSDANSSDNFYHEVIRLSKDKALLFDNGIILEIQLIDQQMDDENLNEIIAKRKDEVLKKGEFLGSKSEKGFLLGLKTETGTKMPTWNYNTVYIKFSENTVENVYEVNNIMVPRDNGFSQINVNRETKGGIINDKLIIENNNNFRKQVPEDTDIMKEPKKFEDKNMLTTIDFVTNNYINLESYNLNNNMRTLRIYNLSDIQNRDPIHYNEFLSEDYQLTPNESLENLESDPFNIGIYRDKGFWKLKGRKTLANGKYEDYDLNLVLPTSVNKYNRLNIPMSDIKNFKPSIKDAFVSPDNKFLITIENNKLRIYNVLESGIDPNFIFEKDIGNNTVCVMSEWAVGKYAKIWKDEIAYK